MKEFLNNRILNITGLACLLWKDKSPDTLRKRLIQKELTDQEKLDAFYIIRDFYLSAKKVFVGRKSNEQD